MLSHQTTLKDLVCLAAKQFAACGIETARLDAELLLAHVLGTDRLHLYREPQQKLTDDQWLHFQELVNRRMQREPVAYLTQEKEFWSLSLFVDPSVLIPRPETELLVEAVLGILQPLDRQGRRTYILELGTGSGAIAIALAKETMHAVIIATDRSIVALRVAQTNIKRHNCSNRVHLVCSDWAQCFPQKQLFHMVVVNPPYIPTEQIEMLAPEIKDYEPLTALDGGKDGLDFYRTWIQFFPGMLKPGGWIALELGTGQAESVAESFKYSQRWVNQKKIQDLYCNDRVILAQTH